MNLFLNHEFQVTNEGCATLKEIKLFLKRIQAPSSFFMKCSVSVHCVVHLVVMSSVCMPWRPVRGEELQFLSLGLSIGWRWMLSFIPKLLYPWGKNPWYPLNKRQVGPQSQSGGFYHHHHQLYSPEWALISSSKCCQRPLSWAAARQCLQPSFLVSSSTPSGHVLVDLLCLSILSYWVFVFIHSLNMACLSQSTGFYYVNYVWFTVKLLCFSIVSLTPLPSLAYWVIYSVKDFPFEDTQSSVIVFCHSPGFCGVCKC